MKHACLVGEVLVEGALRHARVTNHVDDGGAVDAALLDRQTEAFDERQPLRVSDGTLPFCLHLVRHRTTLVRGRTTSFLEALE